MMSTTWCVAIALVLGLTASLTPAAAPPPPLTVAQMEQLLQRNRWIKRANTHHRGGEIDQAIAAIQQGLALERGIFGQVRAVSLSWLDFQAHLHEQRVQFDQAAAARREILRRSAELHGRDDWRVTDARLDLLDTRLLARLDSKQRQHLRQAEQWNSQVVRLWRQGRSKEALPLAQKVLTVRQNLLGEKHRHTAQSWFNLGAQHQALVQLAESERCYRRALEIRKQVLGEMHPDYAICLNNLASLCKGRGEHRLALPLYARALAIRKEVLGEKHSDYATSLNNLATLYRVMGQHQLALPLHQQALRIYKEILGEKHPFYATSLNNLASLYHAMGEHRLALPLYQQALAIRKEVLGQKHPDYASSLNGLALLYKEMGEHRQALPLFRQALRIKKEVLGEKHPDYANSLNNLASLYKAMREYRLALTLFQEVVRLRKEVQGEKHPLYAVSLNNLATLYLARGEYHLALPLFQQALAIRKEVLGQKHPDYTNSLNNLALLYQEMGEYRRALPLYQQALRIRQEVLGEKHPHYAQSLGNLAVLYKAMGKQGAHLVLAGQALAVTQAHLRDSLSVLSDRQRQQLLQQQARRLEVFLSGAQGIVPASVLFEQVASFKDVTSTTLAEQHLAREQPRLRPLLAELRDVRSQLARLGGQVLPGRELLRWRERFDELDRRKTVLEQQLARASTAFAQTREKPTADRVAARLPARAALIEFLSYRHHLRPGPSCWVEEQRLLAFVLRRDREPVLLQLGNADHIDSAVRLWRQSVSADDSAGADALAAGLLRQRLWLPIAKHLDGIDTILIAPDGELSGLPFAALPGDKAGSFLLEKYTFGYLSSGRQLLLPSSSVHGDGLLVLAGANFGTARQTTDPLQRPRRWPPLPGAELEGRQVESAFRARFAESAVRLLSGKQADRAGLLAALERRWRYLHVATHGHFDPPRYALPPAVLGAWSVGAGASPGAAGLTGSLTAALVAQEPGVLSSTRGFDPTGRNYRVQQGNPMLLCSLVLAGVNDTGEAGYLSAEEIALLDLSGCELAVLSACETAAGRQAGWQGVQGLQRGFHQAGARHVLASLWSVSDPATNVLMEEFYDQLWRKKQTPLQALRLAQLAVLKNPNRVRQRALQLRAALAKRGVSESEMQQRGILAKSRKRPTPPASKDVERSPVAWWAAFVLSGRP